MAFHSLTPIQQEAVEYLTTHDKAALFLNCGAGKTRVLLETISHKILTGQAKTVLVIAPIRPIELVWPQEIKKWAPFLTSLNLHKKPYEAGYDVYLVNPHKLQKATFKLPDADILIIDESTYFKNHSSKRFKNIKKQLSKYKYRYILSGTPAPRSYENLWPQYYLLDDGNRLEPTITKYRNRYFYKLLYAYELMPEAKEKIEKAVSDITFRRVSTKSEKPVYNDIAVDIPKVLLQKIKAFQKNGVFELNRDRIVTSSNIATRSKLKQIASGFIYNGDTEDLTVHKHKLDALKELVESLHGAPLLLVYNYKAEKIALQSLKPAVRASFITGCNDVNQWNNGELEMLCIQPQSCGHGLNLQNGGHNICWFSPTDCLELYLQTNARLIRNGQTNTVYIHHLVTTPLEKRIYSNLRNKKNALDGLLKAMEVAA